MAAPARRGRTDSPRRSERATGESRDQIRVLNPTLRNGFAQVPSPVMRARGLSHQAVRLYGLLLDYSWSDNACFPGQTRLAADLDLKSVRSVYTILTELRDYGLIDWHRRPNNSNVYLLLDFTQDPRLAIRRMPDGKPYLERISSEGDAPAPRPDRKKTATPATNPNERPDRQNAADPNPSDRKTSTEPDKQKTADEVYPGEAYSEGETGISTAGSALGDEAMDAAKERVGSSLLGGLSPSMVWASALEELRGRLSEANYRNWVVSARLIGIEGDRLVIAASSSFARDWLAERLADDVARAIARVTGSWQELEFVVRRAEDEHR